MSNNMKVSLAHFQCHDGIQVLLYYAVNLDRYRESTMGLSWYTTDTRGD